MRGRAVLLSLEGRSRAGVAATLGVNRDTVTLWVRRFNEEGLSGLRTRERPGRPPRIADRQKHEILRIALTKPSDLGLPFNTWSTKKLRDYVMAKRIVEGISHEWVRQILLRRGLKFQKARRWQESSDPEYEEKKDRVLRLYNDPPRDGAVVCVDEKGSMIVKEYGGSSWSLEKPHIPERQKIQGRVELTAAYLPHLGHVYYRFSERKSSEEVVELMKAVRKDHSSARLFMILDNHRMHTSKELKGFVEEDGGIDLVYTPKQASWLNAVEQVFSSIQRWVLNNSLFTRAGEIVDAVTRHLTWLKGRLGELLRTNGKFTFGLNAYTFNCMPS